MKKSGMIKKFDCVAIMGSINLNKAHWLMTAGLTALAVWS
jgi:hypothetical protein